MRPPAAEPLLRAPDGGAPAYTRLTLAARQRRFAAALAVLVVLRSTVSTGASTRR